MIHQINIIPENYEGNPQDALGYSWTVYVPKRSSWTEEERKQRPWAGLTADRTKSIPGDDRIGGVAARQAAVAELEAVGLVVVDSQNISKMIEMREAGAVIEARISCMWCGGASYVAYRLPADAIFDTASQTASEVTAGEEAHETVVIVATQEAFSLAELDAQHRHRPGWCNKCHTYCYGDCQAQEG